MRVRARRALPIAAISVFVALSLAGLPHAHAQNADAEALFLEGERLLKAGKPVEACEAFGASNRIESRAGTLINLGYCREQTGQLASAWSAYKDALTRAKDPKKQQIATQRIAAIEPRLSYLTILVPDESRVDGLLLTRNGVAVDQALWNRGVPVDGGTYKVAGRAPGHEQWSTSVEVPKELGKISVEVPRFKDLKLLIAPTIAPKPDTEPLDEEEEQPTVVTGLLTPRRKIAIAAAGVGVVALAGGVVFGVQGKRLEEDANALCPSRSQPCSDAARANNQLETARQRALFANVAYAVGAASLIGAGVLWWLGAPTGAESRIAVTPRGGQGTAAIDVTVRF
jgi:hypothetical protein